MAAPTTKADAKPKTTEAVGAPKRKSSAYQIYMKSALVDLKVSNPSITHKERFKLAAQNWKNDAANPNRVKA